MELDVLIRDGLMFDGTGAEPFPADVALRGELIVEVGDLSSATARPGRGRGCLRS